MNHDFSPEDRAFLDQINQAVPEPDMAFRKALAQRIQKRESTLAPLWKFAGASAAALILLIMVSGGAWAATWLFYQPDTDDRQTAVAVQAPDHAPAQNEVEHQPIVIDEAGQVIPFEEANIPPLVIAPLESAPFHVYLPGQLPVGYQAGQASYHPEGPMTWIEFTCGSNMGFSLSQNQISYEAFLAEPAYRGEIGVSAQIQTVDINGVQGEYVYGDWVALVPPDFSQATPNTVVEFEQVWDSTAYYHRLIWYVEGSLLRLTSSRYSPGESACELGMEDILSIARSLQ